MKNIIFSSILFIVSYFMIGCIDDKSKDFQFNMPNVIIGSDDNINFPVKKEKTYTPTIEWANTDSTNYDFLWTYNGREKLSTEKTLTHTFTEAGTFYLTFQMTDRTSKLTYGQDFKLTVSSEYFLGWLILAEDETDGHSALSFIHMQTYELYPDVYKTLYPNNPLGSKPYRIETHYTSKADEILIMQKGGDGLVELNGSNFKKVIRTEEEFIGGAYPYAGFNPIRVAYTHKGPELLLTDQGEIYDRINKKTTSMFQTAFNSAEYGLLNLIFTSIYPLSSYPSTKQSRYISAVIKDNICLILLTNSLSSFSTNSTRHNAAVLLGKFLSSTPLAIFINSNKSIITS